MYYRYKFWFAEESARIAPVLSIPENEPHCYSQFAIQELQFVVIQKPDSFSDKPEPPALYFKRDIWACKEQENVAN